MTKKFNQYLGKAGHLVVMSEFLMRGWNVAIPEVDTGDDIFVVRDDKGTLRRVQVKTSTSTIRKNHYTGQFSVSANNLKNISETPVHYVFLVRHNEEWSKIVIMKQETLLDHFQNNNVGSEAKGNITFYFSYKNDKIECSGQDFSIYIRDFTDFPEIMH